MSEPVTTLEDVLLAALNDTPDPSYRAERGLSMSGLGGCRRQGVYALARTPHEAEEPDDTAAAEVGTALHRAVLPYMAEKLGGTYEVEVVWESPAGPINGTVDLLLPDRVVDLKTVGRNVFDLLRVPRNGWLHQVTAAALATGREKCAVLVLCRDTGRRKAFHWNTDERQAEVEAWTAEVAWWWQEGEAPRDYRGPGVDRECDWCAYRSLCWPHIEGAEPQAALVHDNPAVASMMESYLDAAKRERDAAADKDFAKKCLTGSANGVYGDYKLVWSKRGGKMVPDADAMAEALQAAGLDVPLKVGREYRAITVKPA